LFGKFFKGRSYKAHKLIFKMNFLKKFSFLILIFAGFFAFVNIAEAGTKLDLIFVIDLTGSMGDDIAQVKDQASEIVDDIADSISDYRIAIVGYRDFSDSVMFEDYAFSRDKDEILENINSLTVYGGGDWPEAVYEGLMRAIETEEIGSWRDGVSKKIILMGDAPPHEKGDGPEYIYTLDDVAEAAYNVDPANVYSIVIGDDDDAADSFRSIARETDGSYFAAADASEVPEKIKEATKKLTEDAEKEQAGSWLKWALIIGGILVGIAVIVGIIIAIVLATKKR